MESVFTEDLISLQFREGKYLFSRVEVLRLDGSHYQAVHTHGRLGNKGSTHLLLQDGTRDAALAAARQKVAERRAEGYLLLGGVIRAVAAEAQRQARDAAGGGGTEPAVKPEGTPSRPLGLSLPSKPAATGSDRAQHAKGTEGESGNPRGAVSPGVQAVLQRLGEIAASVRTGALDSRSLEDLTRYAHYRLALIRRQTAAVIEQLLPQVSAQPAQKEQLQALLTALCQDAPADDKPADVTAGDDKPVCDRCGAAIDPRKAQKISAWARGDGGWDLDPTFVGYQKLLCMDCQVELGVFRHRAERTADGGIRWVALERDRD